MKKCRDNDIIPKGFRSKKSIRETENPSLNRMNKKLEEKRLRSEICNAKTKQSTHEQEIKRLQHLLAQSLEKDDLNIVYRNVKKSREWTWKTISQQHHKKFELLKREKK